MRRTVVDDPENPSRPAIGMLLHDLINQAIKGGDSGFGFAATEEFGLVDVQVGQIGPSSQPLVFVLDFHRLTGWCRYRGRLSAARLNTGVLLGREDESVRRHVPPLPEPAA